MKFLMLTFIALLIITFCSCGNNNPFEGNTYCYPYKQDVKSCLLFEEEDATFESIIGGDKKQYFKTKYTCRVVDELEQIYFLEFAHSDIISFTARITSTGFYRVTPPAWTENEFWTYVPDSEYQKIK